MPKHEIVGSVDIGSNHVACVIGRLTDSGIIEVLGGGRSECSGIKNGVVTSMKEASDDIKNAIETAEENAGADLRKMYVALRGSHIESHSSHGTLGISRTDKEITTEDVEGVIDNAKMNIRLSHDREIVHAIPQSFTVNGQAGVTNPVGMDGSHLEVNVHVVTASCVHMNTLQKAIARGGFEITEFVYGILALGESVVTQEEKELGCLLIDIGGYSTGLVIYQSGHIQASREMELGGDFISKDLAHNLRTKIQTAAQIKEKYGVAEKKLLKNGESNQKIEYISLDGKTMRDIKRHELVHVIEARVDQIATLASDTIVKDGYSFDLFSAGVIITGGASQLKGIDAYFEDALKTIARIGNVNDVEGEASIVNNPSYYTAISLLKYHFGDLRQTTKQRVGAKKSILSSLTKWWDETF